MLRITIISTSKVWAVFIKCIYSIPIASNDFTCTFVHPDDYLGSDGEFTDDEDESVKTDQITKNLRIVIIITSYASLMTSS